LDKIRNLRIIYSLSIFSVGNTRTPWGDAPKFDTVLAHLLRKKDIFLFVNVLSRFELTRFRLTAGWRNLKFSPAKFFRGGVKMSKVSFKA